METFLIFVILALLLVIYKLNEANEEAARQLWLSEEILNVILSYANIEISVEEVEQK